MSKHLRQKSTAPRSIGPVPARRVASPGPNRFHRFLRRLSAGGRSNMYGAIPYLMHAFQLDREQAFRVVCEWVDQQESESQVGPADASPHR